MSQVVHDARLGVWIDAKRDVKARRFARALWDAWTPEERAGAGVAALERRAPDWWQDLATSIGAREPSAETRALVIAKLKQASSKPPSPR